MTGYVLSEDADRDLDDIWEYIAADRWIAKRSPYSRHGPQVILNVK